MNSEVIWTSFNLVIKDTCWRAKKVIFLLHLFRIRLISLASQKFISDIANDALQYCKMKGTASGSSRSKTKVRPDIALRFSAYYQCCWSKMQMPIFLFRDFSFSLLFSPRIKSTLWQWRTWHLPCLNME